jgi:iron complex outermembrane receptor protein
MVYANYSKGFKSGGFNSSLCGNEFEPESLYAYELGSKAEFFDRRVRLNLAAFWYDYEDMQARQILTSSTVVTNAAEARIYGLEAETLIHLPWNFTIDAGLMLLNAENESYEATDPMFPGLGVQDLKGKELLRSPDWRANIGIQYDIDMSEMGSLSLRYELSASDNLYYDVFNNDFAEQEAYEVTNLRLTWNAGENLAGVSVQAFVENLSDEEYVEANLAGSLWGGVISHYAPPRWAGVSLRYSWGG